MKSIFDKADRDSVIGRIDLLSESVWPIWGTMTVAQMCKHCAICEEYYFGNIKKGRSFLGRLVGKMAIKAILKDDESGINKNAPTAPVFLVKDSGLNFEQERTNWKRLISRYETYQKDSFIHWFFGKMSKEQLGQFIYKHSDHHLKQFGVD